MLSIWLSINEKWRLRYLNVCLVSTFCWCNIWVYSVIVYEVRNLYELINISNKSLFLLLILEVLLLKLYFSIRCLCSGLIALNFDIFKWFNIDCTYNKLRRWSSIPKKKNRHQKQSLDPTISIGKQNGQCLGIGIWPQNK